MLRGGDVKQIYEMRGAGHSTRAIARELGLARNTVLRYLKSPEAIRPKPRSRRGSKLDPYTEHIDRRLGDGLGLTAGERAAVYAGVAEPVEKRRARSV